MADKPFGVEEGLLTEPPVIIVNVDKTKMAIGKHEEFWYIVTKYQGCKHAYRSPPYLTYALAARKFKVIVDVELSAVNVEAGRSAGDVSPLGDLALNPATFVNDKQKQ